MGKNSKKNNGNNFADQVQIFINWGLWGGVLIPFMSMAIILICPKFTNPVVESRKIWVIVTMFGYIFVMFMIGFFILALYRKEYSKRRNSIAGVLLYILGFLSLFVLYFLILWTGGLPISSFSGYFIYVPVVVFLSFGKFSKVLLAGVLSIILAICSTPIIINPITPIIINPVIHFFPSTLKSVVPWIATAEYQLHYLFVVITQVVVSMQVARISSDKDEDKRETDKLIIILVHALIGWVLCGATMGIGMAVTSIENALIIHAIAAPIIFTIVSLIYYKKFNYTTPFKTAIIFVSLVVFMDVFVVALLIEKNFEMFTNILGTWIIFTLIFISTYLTGLYAKK